MSGVKELSIEDKENLSQVISDEEIKIIESWRHIEFGKIVCRKRDGKLNGRVEIVTTY